MSPNNSELALNYRSTSNTAIDAAFDDGGSGDTGVLNSAVGGAVTARFFLDSGSASNSNKLSPSSVASAVAAAAAATASSLSAAQMSSSSSNLLSPRTHIGIYLYLLYSTNSLVYIYTYYLANYTYYLFILKIEILTNNCFNR